MGCDMPCSIRRARLKAEYQRCSMEGSANCPQLYLCLARFRLSFASRTAEHPTDQLTLPLPAVPCLPVISAIYRFQSVQ
jgi:hypothetical protein